jgi:hypothetical protein
MLKKIILATATATLAMSAFAAADQTPQKAYQLKDGSTVYVFSDGKMGMEDKYGRAFMMREGHAMETVDGQKIVMKGSEVWRVEKLIAWHRGS